MQVSVIKNHHHEKGTSETIFIIIPWKEAPQLEATVQSLTTKVETLETQVSELSSLKTDVEKLKDVNAVCSQINDNLVRELESLQQYSRRNCIVLEGIKVKRDETIPELENAVKSILKNEFKLEEKETNMEFDKTHRIGGITQDRQQRVIVRFKSHGFCSKVYNRRKQSKRIYVKPSLTKFRLDTLKQAKERYGNSSDVEFIYADILGNLKIRLKNPLNGRFVHEFYNLNELSDILFDADLHFYEL